MMWMRSWIARIGFGRLRIGGAAVLLASLTLGLASCRLSKQEPMPVDEARFISTVSSFISNYNSASNMLEKSTLRATRGEELRKIMPDLKFAGWVGTLKDVTTTPTGDTAIAIQLPGSNITVRTLNKSFADVSSHTLITHDSPLAGQVSALSKGDKINFDGSFVLDGIDWVKEVGANELDSMTKPEYLVQFKDVTKKLQ
jgi:hypothetical protein